MIYTPDMNDGKHIFVFGSNLAGIHGAGAALEAKRHWGAVQYHRSGRSGYSYAIPTKDAEIKTLPLGIIRFYVNGFLVYAKPRQDYKFLVTAIGCGLAGYKDSDIAPMFKNAPQNCILPEGWR